MNGKYWTDGKRTKAYRNSLIKQDLLWMIGISRHNTFSNECTNDFSCCHPHYKTKWWNRLVDGAKSIWGML